jgi:hypothetical protein
VKAYVDAGRAFLELGAQELRTLFIAIDRESDYHRRRSEEMEAESEHLDDRARTEKRGRHALRRRAGELRRDASGHRACANEAEDLRCVLLVLTKNPEVK